MTGKLQKYVKPKSLTWYASLAPLVAGVIVALEPVHGLHWVVRVIDNFTGDAHPAVLINVGLAGIGLRGAIPEK
ncbi:hypothetical protein [Marinibacterium profundimaris]|uniref:Uncharacterized protein n=1 Tax=Marinibacterium profundimaris TaxID=1679460 RepID=A0A225NRN0_9RHOB|nr:hypothetical protein [Marinibacterium profundimaris]OWU77591.1 hypothetical protein ATO3_02570 [Marinibacterium profundimaris]